MSQEPTVATAVTAGRCSVNRLVRKLPCDEEMVPELAFPDGLRVIVGPSQFSIITGTVDWSVGKKDWNWPHVPVRVDGLTPRFQWSHPRWLIPLPNASDQRHLPDGAAGAGKEQP
jgi:hypothetical protein